MPTECAASFDSLRVVSKANPVERLCVLEFARIEQACAALRLAVDC